MKPYLAVIYDSFVEAINSKVLWVLLIGWTAVLAAIAPFGFIHEKSYEFTASDILNRQGIVEKLEMAANHRGTRAQQAVFEALKPETQEQFSKTVKKGERRPGLGRIAENLNEALKAQDLYREDAWPRVSKRSELKELVAIDGDQLSADQLKHRNRRLIELAFPSQLKQVNENRVWVGYAGLKLFSALPITEKQAKEFVEVFILQSIMKIGLGVVAILIAIVITSPMIPDMFQTGSLHLLLSKPISRSLLFLSKVIGGCIFVGINIAFLLIGLYLIAGMRLGIWNSGILLCIPVFVFIFLIFYSVSALAGLVWKNAIVCVVVTCLFWAFCFTIGLLQGVIQNQVVFLKEIVQITPQSGALMAANQDGNVSVWDEASGQWQAAFNTRFGGQMRVIGPFYLKKYGELHFARAVPFGDSNFNGVKLSVASLPELKETPPSESETKLWADSRVDSGPDFPPNTRSAIPWNETFVVLTDTGLYRFDRDAAMASEEEGIGGFLRDAISNLVPSESQAFRRMTSEAWQPQGPMDLAATPDGKTLLVYTRGKLQWLSLESNNQWHVGKETRVTDDAESLALVEVNSTHWLIMEDDAVPRIGSLETEEPIRMLEQIGKITPRSLVVSPTDEGFALLTADGDVWLVSRDGSQVRRADGTGQGKVTAIAFDSTGKLLVAHDIHQVDQWDLATNSSTALVRPKMRTIDWVFHWIVNPIYIVNPKPSAVDDTIFYCLKKEGGIGLVLETAQLSSARVKINPWRPLWSNSIFIAIILGIGCVYLYRQDL